MHHLIKRAAKQHPRLRTDSIRAEGAQPRTGLSAPPAAPAPPGPRAGAAAPRPGMLRRPHRSAPPHPAPQPHRPTPHRAEPPPAAALPRRAAACAPPRPEPGGGRWVPGAAAAQRGPGPARHAGTRSSATSSPQHHRPQRPGCLLCPAKANQPHVQSTVIAPHLWLVVMRAQGD